MSAARTLAVIRAGLLTTVQDRGRWGHQASGVPVAGPMDLTSHDAANTAVGNDKSAATLEVTIVGPELRFETPAVVAIAGADLGAALDGVPLLLNQPQAAAAGSILRFGQRRRGARAYVAVDGGIDAPMVLGSRATHAADGFGRPLAAGDVVPLGAAHGRTGMTPITRDVPSGGGRVRVRRGPQADGVPEDAFITLTTARFVVGSQSNRMGYRLSGPAVSLGERPPMISDVTFMGGIQITPSGEAILLMADRQTTGGYPQIATVITADLPVVGQLAPGDWIEFEIQA